MDTPVATMGIRGTAVSVDISADNGTTRFFIVREPDGRVGSYVLYSRSDPSQVIATVSQSDTGYVVAPNVPAVVVANNDQPAQQALVARIVEIGLAAAANPIVQQAPPAPNQPPAPSDPNAQPPGRTGDQPLAAADGGGSGTGTAVAADASTARPSSGDGGPRDVVRIDDAAALAERGLGIAPTSGGQSRGPTLPTPQGGGNAPTDGGEGIPAPNPASAEPTPLVNYFQTVAASDGVFVLSSNDGVLGRIVDAETGERVAPQGEHVVSVRSLSAGGESQAVAGSGSTTVQGRYGTLVISSDGTYFYLPSTAAAVALPGAAHGEDNFEITVDTGSVAPSELTFDVVGIDDAPVVQGNVHGSVVAAGTLAAASSAAAGVLFDDADPDAGETAALRVQSARAQGAATDTALTTDAGATGTSATIVGAYGTLTIHGDGTYSYMADHAQRLRAGVEATDRFIYTASPDGKLRSAGSLEFQVVGVNDRPSGAAVGNDAEGIEDRAASGRLPAGSDVDGDALTYEVVAGSAVGGSVSVGPDGSYRFTPNADFNGDASFAYVVRDTSGVASPPELFTVTLTAVNDAPVANDISVAATEDTPVRFDVAAFISDVDTGDTLTVTATVPAGQGTVSVAGTLITFRPAVNFNGAAAIAYSVRDSAGTPLADAGTISVDVAGANDAPVADDAAVATPEDTPVTVDVAALISDFDAGDALTVTATVPAGQGTVSVSGTLITFAPAANFNGAAAITYTVRDGAGVPLSESGTIAVEVAAIDDAPVANAGSATVLENGIVTGVATATDVDTPPAGLTYSLADGAAHGAVVVAADGSYVYTPVADFHGTDAFTFLVTDDTGETSNATISVVVQEVAAAPVLTLASTTPLQPADGAAMRIVLTLNAGDTVSFNWNFVANDYLPFNDFSFASIDGETYLLGLTQSVGDYGTTGWKTFTFTATHNGTTVLGIGQFNGRDTALDSHTYVDGLRVNGNIVSGFEGGFGAWQVSGDATVTGQRQDGAGAAPVTITPTEGGSMALVNSGPRGVGQIEAFLGLDSGEVAQLGQPAGVAGSPVAVPLTVTTSASDNPDRVYVTITGAPVGAIFSAGQLDTATGAWIVEAAELGGNFTVTTPSGFTGSFTLTVTATSVVNASGTTASSAPQTIEIDIVPGNTAPIASGATLTVAENGSAAGSVSATDAETPDGLFYGMVSGPTSGSVVFDEDATYTSMPDTKIAGAVDGGSIPTVTSAQLPTGTGYADIAPDYGSTYSDPDYTYGLADGQTAQATFDYGVEDQFHPVSHAAITLTITDGYYGMV
ncbi:tandem-95 repeat protein [uncultured Enterovirga sp.]|uniref:tandem-95 repeat protein n=1 Tax=uncultured Enterovirga sp. TaxID=2026352 RepID=UPI0035CAD9EF